MAEWTFEKEWEAIQEAIGRFNREQEDPHFLVLGSTGAGKSSLVNRIFKKRIQKVTHVASTTRDFSTHKHLGEDGNANVLITDSPGYGEVGRDGEYSASVVEESRRSHVILLVLKADEKGYQRDIDVITRVFDSPEFSAEQPLLIVLNQIDKLPPTRDWSPPYDVYAPPSPDDSQKLSNIKDKIALVKSQFQGVLKREPIVCATMCDDEEEDEQMLFGVQDIREQLFDVLPDVARLKYARASAVAEEASAKLMEKLDEEADNVIRKAALAAAGAVAANPVPASDWVVLTPLQITMIVKIGAAYGKPISPAFAKETVAALGAGFAARTVFQGVISFFPGVKNGAPSSLSGVVKSQLTHFEEEVV